MSHDAAADLMRKLAEALQNNLSDEEMEKRIESALQSDAMVQINAVDQTSAHRGLSTEVHRTRDVNERDIARYERLLDAVKAYSKTMQKKVGAILEDMRDGSVDHHKPCGRLVEANNGYKLDGCFFANKMMPQDLPDMAIAVLVDQSNSMSGERIASAMQAAILLDDFATSLGIPVMVAGHNTALHERGTSIYLHALFERAGKKDKYRLAQMLPAAANRDGMAIQIVADMLAKRPEEIKLLIIISDGQPNDSEYGGKEAAEDIHSIVAHAKARGVQTFAAAIGSDKDNIQAIYGDGYLNITDLSTLPKTMVRLIAKRLI